MSRMGVLHVVQSLEPGGLENGVVNLVNRLSDRFDAHIFCVRRVGAFGQRVTREGCVIIDGKYRGGLWDSVRQIREFCRDREVEVVHTHGWGTFLVGYLAAKLAGVPAVINGEHGVIYADTLKRRLVQGVLMNLVDLNLAVSEDLRREIMERFRVRGSRIRTIENGVDTDRFRVSEAERGARRSALGIPRDAFVAGTVGRLVPVKDYPTLVRGYAGFRKRHPDGEARLVLVGLGEEYDRLRALAGEFGVAHEVILAGFQEDVPGFLNLMDIFVLTSEKEGMSNTILEAMACGKPVLATRVPGNQSLVKDRVTGELFGFGDADALADALARLMNDRELLGQYSRNALDKIARENSLEVMVRNYEAAYAGVLGK
jgi:sugar transferase (PEP-CTERM/EpsH1 system associated)